jgi:hypothetical protein
MKTFCVNTRILHALFLLILCGLPAREIHAESVIYHFDTYFGVSSVDPGSYGPWVIATFEDVTPGVVRLTMQNSSTMPTSQKVAELDFNLNPALNVNSLLFSVYASGGSFQMPAINQATDGFRSGGDGSYDVQFAFNVSGSINSGKTFTLGEYVVYTISGIAGLTANDFAFLSQPGTGNNAGPYYASGHILGIGSSNNSAWIAPSGLAPVPEPSAAALLLVGGGLAMRFIRRKKP